MIIKIHDIFKTFIKSIIYIFYDDCNFLKICKNIVIINYK